MMWYNEKFHALLVGLNGYNSLGDVRRHLSNQVYTITSNSFPSYASSSSVYRGTRNMYENMYITQHYLWQSKTVNNWNASPKAEWTNFCLFIQWAIRRVCWTFFHFAPPNLSIPFYYAVWKQEEGIDGIKNIGEMAVFKEMKYTYPETGEKLRN